MQLSIGISSSDITRGSTERHCAATANLSQPPSYGITLSELAPYPRLEQHGGKPVPLMSIAKIDKVARRLWWTLVLIELSNELTDRFGFQFLGCKRDWRSEKSKVRHCAGDDSETVTWLRNRSSPLRLHASLSTISSLTSA